MQSLPAFREISLNCKKSSLVMLNLPVEPVKNLTWEIFGEVLNTPLTCSNAEN